MYSHSYDWVQQILAKSARVRASASKQTKKDELNHLRRAHLQPGRLSLESFLNFDKPPATIYNHSLVSKVSTDLASIGQVDPFHVKWRNLQASISYQAAS